MRPRAKVVGFVCLLTGLTVGALVSSLVAHRSGQGHEQGGKPAKEQDPEVSTFFNSASSLLTEFARGADGLAAGGGGGKNSAGHDRLFDHQMTRWYFVLSCKLTLDPKFQKAMVTHLRELDEKLIAL